LAWPSHSFLLLYDYGAFLHQYYVLPSLILHDTRCYKTLGHLFTFEITIRPKHELITHGPYAYVRHPSYTGIYLTLIGATFVLLAPGTWTAEYGIRSSIGAFLLGVWLFKCAFAFRGTAIRLRAEDALLRTNFGEEWEDYAKRVPFKLIPLVY
jgi:protein-S-isoprenylcysteine O-methyltransferase Ste14